MIVRRAVLAGLLAAFCLSLGCDGGDSKNSNPNNLPYSQEGPPKRDAVKDQKKKR